VIGIAIELSWKGRLAGERRHAGKSGVPPQRIGWQWSDPNNCSRQTVKINGALYQPSSTVSRRHCKAERGRGGFDKRQGAESVERSARSPR
jgi:hypothetical protein